MRRVREAGSAEEGAEAMKVAQSLLDPQADLVFVEPSATLEVGDCDRGSDFVVTEAHLVPCL